MKDFVKERAEIESEYSKKLSALGSKYMDKLHKDINAPECKQIWGFVLNDCLKTSEVHSDYANNLNLNIQANLKVGISRRSTNLERLTQFMETLLLDREKVFSSSAKAKTLYFKNCEIVRDLKGKYERSNSESVREKQRQKLHWAILDMNNSKVYYYNSQNEYLMALNVSNDMISYFHTEFVAEILQLCAAFNTSVCTELMAICNKISKEELFTYKTNLENSSKMAKSLESHTETIKLNFQLSFNNEEYVLENKRFEACGFWKENSANYIDGHSVVYLQNRLIRLQDKLENTIEELEQLGAIEFQLDSKISNCILNPLLGDNNFAEEKLQIQQEILRKRWKMAKRKQKIVYLQNIVGALPPGVKPHSFGKTSVAIPVICEICNQKIWGVTRVGLMCKGEIDFNIVCKFYCHVKCENLTLPRCSYTLGKKSKQKPLHIDTFTPSTQRSISDCIASPAPNQNTCSLNSIRNLLRISFSDKWASKSE
jgi:hypothetical protein